MINADELYGKGWIDEPESEKAFKAEEIISAFPPVTWTEKPVASWKRRLPIRNQAQSSSCVAFTTALILGNENAIEEGKFVVLSPRSIYPRGFLPGGGMYFSEGMKIGNEKGATLEHLLPSEGKDESGMKDLSDEKESDRLAAKIYRGGSFIYLPKDIESIASVIAMGKIVALGVRFNSGGFGTGEVKLHPGGVYGHAIGGTDYTIWKGEKALVFQNSWTNTWGFSGMGVITESQMTNTGFSAAIYFENLQNTPGTVKPTVKIKAISLNVGQNNKDVIAMQIILQFLGYFPQNQDITGYYGGISRQGVKDFQKKEGLPDTGIADENTIKKLNAKVA